MKPNGKYSVIRVAVLALFAVASLTTFASAESEHGIFKLTSDTRWGSLLLSPGEYEFTISKDVSGFMVTVRSRDTGWSGMVLAQSRTDAPSSDQTRLVIARSGTGMYVRELCLGESGVILDYQASKSERLTRLAKPVVASTRMASASGGQ